MNLYYDPIIEILENNTGITKSDLYRKSGLPHRQFITQLNRLIKEYRIEVDGEYEYYPRMLWLYEFSKEYRIQTNSYLLNYLPIDELEKGLEYINTGTEQEDCLDFELQITEFYLKEKDKAFIEMHNDLELDFEKFDYQLRSEYLEGKKEKNKNLEKAVTLVYIDNDELYANEFMKIVGSQYIPNCIWHYFTDTISAFDFIEKALKQQLRLDVIITENNTSIDGMEFLEALRGIEFEMEEKYIDYFFAKIALTIDKKQINFKTDPEYRPKLFLHIKKLSDEYIIGNIIKTLAHRFTLLMA